MSRFWTSSTQLKNTAFIEETFQVQIKDPGLYHLAAVHRSAALKVSNERLELLGDAVLDLILTHHLYDLRPEADEGYMTRLRSKLVSRTNLSRLAALMGMAGAYAYEKQRDLPDELIMGNALEALVGALYLDQGYEVTYARVIDLFERHISIEELELELVDPKSRLLEWAQSKRYRVEYRTGRNTDTAGERFISRLWVEGECIAEGTGESKKMAEKKASDIAWKTHVTNAF
jgi:ribonuclease-3